MTSLNSKTKPLVIIITGPTASGKSKLAVELALKLNSEIISADSMQIYRGANIATAKMPLPERKGIKHHLLDIVDLDANYSVADFTEDALNCCNTIVKKGKIPIVCGGSYQYIAALLDGIHFCPHKVEPGLRAAWQARIQTDGALFWHEIMRQLDEEAAVKIHPNDSKRLGRFFELYQTELRPQTEIKQLSRCGGSSYSYLSFVLLPQRDELYQKINQRCQLMFTQGIVKELEQILRAKPSLVTSQCFQAIGYKEILPCLEGLQSREEAWAKLAQNSRRYAKRQLSFMRSRPELIELPADDLKLSLAHILAQLPK